MTIYTIDEKELKKNPGFYKSLRTAYGQGNTLQANQEKKPSDLEKKFKNGFFEKIV
ncbi:MAG: hypothetical protein WC812_00830 [Candidatus Pacearchaeota archaeon]|jgi:hypothetical protein